jgi:hypothetical protein
MSTFRIKLVRPTKHVMLELTEGGVAAKGTWKRITDQSNSALEYETGTWEQWEIGSPGGIENIRLYSPTDTKSALLEHFTAVNTEGPGSMIIENFGAEFGSDPFQWFKVL